MLLGKLKWVWWLKMIKIAYVIYNQGKNNLITESLEEDNYEQLLQHSAANAVESKRVFVSARAELPVSCVQQEICIWCAMLGSPELPQVSGWWMKCHPQNYFPFLSMNRAYIEKWVVMCSEERWVEIAKPQVVINVTSSWTSTISILKWLTYSKKASVAFLNRYITLIYVIVICFYINGENGEN